MLPEIYSIVINGGITFTGNSGLSKADDSEDAGTVNASNNYDNCCIWILAVIYKNPTL